ncbi:S8 family serine peptidase [Xylanimonas sp. McL0601]|uniref:S8 family serine peptidase n=1 Tax=Xylanimonas sp. McL0601 TaxID=3414739 RepID=UPI003CF5B8F9
MNRLGGAVVAAALAASLAIAWPAAASSAGASSVGRASSGTSSVGAGPGTAAATLDPAVEQVLAALPPGATTTVVVTLRGRANLAGLADRDRGARVRGVVAALRATADTAQRPLRAALKVRAAHGEVTAVRPLWVVDGLTVTGTAPVVRQIAARADVERVALDSVVVTPTAGAAGPNVAAVHAPELWDQGVTGAGVVVATLDSGVDVSHPDLISRWRGGSNSWFDPYGQHPTVPTDLTGHGTATTGVIVGGDSSGTAIGVAPGARWIAAKIFDDSGAATLTALHQAFQWVLDPDGDPSTADAPQVVNGSWSLGSGPGCDLALQPDVQALRAAGILPVFAAGNFGSAASTSVSPANYPESLAVGAISATGLVAASSSRGPSTCGGRGGQFPDVVAPGVNVLTADRYGLYQQVSGTSVAAPHVAGALALLIGAVPALAVDRERDALTGTATDLGIAGPDPKYGFGRVDALAAYRWLTSGPDFAVDLSPGVVTVQPGGTASLAATVTPANGFTGDVSLSLSGLGADQATWASQPAVVTGGAGSATLTVVTSPGLPPGTYPLVVTAVSGGTTRLASAALTVTSPPGDVAGPTTATPVLVGTPANGSADVAVHAIADDTATGGSAIAAGEYTVDGGLGAPMSVSAAGAVADLDATIPAAVVAGLADGPHTVAVRARDAAGAWGPAASTTLVVDTLRPTVTALVSPDPTQGAPTATLSGTATDANGIVAAEWFDGADPGPGHGAVMVLTGTGTGTGSTALTASVDVAAWSPGSHTLVVRARDAAGNWSAGTPVSLTVTATAASLSFSTLGSSNPPTVTGTADDADVYAWSGSAFSRAFDASTHGVPVGANVDGLDRVDATHLYLSFADTVSITGLGTVEDEDVVYYADGVWSLWFDGSARGLTSANLDLDAISVVGGTLYFSTLGNTNPPGVAGTADDADIYSWNGTGFARVLDATAVGIPAAANVDGFVRVDGTHDYFSFAADTTVTGLGAVQDEDVVHRSGTSWNTYFDGTAHNLTSANLDIDAFDIEL